jgi:hypothetical protein
MAREDDSVESEDERNIDVDGSFCPALPSPAPGSSTSSSSSLTPSNLRPELTHEQRYAKESRAWQRAAMQELHPPEDHYFKSAALKKQTNLEAILTPTDAEEFNPASTGWVGVRVPTEKKNFTLEEVMGAPYNMRHVQ